MHEYKRQLLNIFQVYDLYQQLKQNPNKDFTPTTYIYGAKAAPGYKVAKGIIRLINDVAQIVNGDSDVKDKLKVVLLKIIELQLQKKYSLLLIFQNKFQLLVKKHQVLEI